MNIEKLVVKEMTGELSTLQKNEAVICGAFELNNQLPRLCASRYQIERFHVCLVMKVILP